MRPAPSGWSNRDFGALFVLMTVLLGSWTLATPRLASPDEPAHLIKAAAVARGQFLGPQDPGGTFVILPPGIGASQGPVCFALKPTTTAKCLATQADTGEIDIVLSTTAGRYPPAYYALVGLPTLLSTDLNVLYAMRLVSALLCSALLAAALTIAVGSGRRALPLAVGLAMTPMVLFLSSVVNPSGLEVAGALAFWAAGAVLVAVPGPPATATLNVAGLGAVALVLARPVSPLWLALIGLTLLLCAGWRRLSFLAKDHRVRRWVVGLVAVGLAQVGWVLAVGASNVFGTGNADPPAQRLERMLSLVPGRGAQMIGNFGWLDTPLPTPAVVAWLVAALALVLVCARRILVRRLLGLLLLFALCLVVPVVLEYREIPAVGYWWQGRYTMPIAVGLPVLIALLPARPRRIPWPVVAGVFAVVAGVQIVAFIDALARYTVGDGRGLGLVGRQWDPPGGAPWLVVAQVLVVIVLHAWLARLTVRAQPVAVSVASPCLLAAPALTVRSSTA